MAFWEWVVQFGNFVCFCVVLSIAYVFVVGIIREIK